MMGGRRVILAAGLAMLLLGCERAPAPAKSDSGNRGVSRIAEGHAPSTLHDWVLNPSVAEDEREGECPRLLSAAPNVTEICCALGLADCLIGRTRYCTYPPSIQAVRSIGALNDLNVEVLLELKPDMILVAGTSRAQTDRLSALNLAFDPLPDVSLADLYVAIERVGALTHRTQTAERLAAGVRADIEAVAARFAAGPPARVLLVTAPLPDPPTQADAAGPGTFYDDLLRRAGHVNVVGAGGRPFTPLSLEFVLQADPDVIIELAPDHAARPGGDDDARRVWAKLGPLKAVAGQRVHVLVGSQHFILGPRVAQTFEALCETIVGDQHE